MSRGKKRNASAEKKLLPSDRFESFRAEENPRVDEALPREAVLMFGIRWTILILLFHERLQPRERLLPLPGNEEQIILGLLQRFRLEFVKTFSSNRFRSHQSGDFQHAQMLRNCLPRDRRSLGQLRDRSAMRIGESREKRESPLIAERRENPYIMTKLPRRSKLATLARHDVRCSSTARTSHHRSCGMLHRDDQPGAC